METTVFVISDLHLGGTEDFQMCSKQGQERLAEFITWVATQPTDARRIELVVAGDIVDFLAVEDRRGGTWSAFTADEDEAVRKLNQIIAVTAPVWTALAACVAKKCHLTLLLGNHDIELSFPAVRRRLREQLGPGSVEFLYDNQAYTRGALLIEHGNRYEGWNVVDHDALRRVRSELSRGVQVSDFPAQPGSNLVVRVMNKLKRDYPWVDLLKPETSGVVPLLAAMNASLWSSVGPAILAGLGAAKREHQFGSDRMPTKESYIAQQVSSIDGWVASNLPPGATQIAGANTFKKDVVFSAIRKWGESDGRSFCVESEDKRYVEAAGALAQQGFEVVIFGHTHHVKRISLPAPSSSIYFNTGTWADLIKFPPAVFEADDAAARTAFDGFFASLQSNDIAAIRRLLPTFARVDFDANDTIMRSDVYFFDGPGQDQMPRVDSKGILARLS